MSRERHASEARARSSGAPAVSALPWLGTLQTCFKIFAIPQSHMSALESYGLLPAKRVRRCLEEANRYGVAASVLLTHDGSLLCSAGFDSLALPLEPHTVGAIAANVWGHYAAAGAQAGAGAARTMLCEVEGGMLGVCAACDSK